MATNVPALNEDVVCGLNNTLCLEIVPRQRHHIHLTEREHRCNCYSFYRNHLKTNLEALVYALVNNKITYGWVYHALHCWQCYLLVLSQLHTRVPKGVGRILFRGGLSGHYSLTTAQREWYIPKSAPSFMWTHYMLCCMWLLTNQELNPTRGGRG